MIVIVAGKNDLAADLAFRLVGLNAQALNRCVRVVTQMPDRANLEAWDIVVTLTRSGTSHRIAQAAPWSVIDTTAAPRAVVVLPGAPIDGSVSQLLARSLIWDEGTLVTPLWSWLPTSTFLGDTITTPDGQRDGPLSGEGLALVQLLTFIDGKRPSMERQAAAVAWAEVQRQAEVVQRVTGEGFMPTGTDYTGARLAAADMGVDLPKRAKEREPSRLVYTEAEALMERVLGGE